MTTTLEKKLHNYDGTCLPEEVIYEILLYLSPKDLLSFKTVSKHWCSLISHPNFAKAHFNFNLNRPSKSKEEEIVIIKTKPYLRCKFQHYSVINIQKDDGLRAIELRMPLHNKDEEFLCLEGSCDGLLLFHDKRHTRQFYISNPVTGHFERLPLIPLDCCDWVGGRDADCLCCFWALARDTRINKYKVFGIVTKFQYVVLTLGENGNSHNSNSWKAQTIRNLKRVNFCIITQILQVQKELHWLTVVHDYDIYDEYQNRWYCISSLNIETLEFSENKIPPYVATPLISDLYYETHREHYRLLEVKGMVCLMTASHDELKMFILEDKLQCVWTNSQIVLLESLPNLPSFYDSFLAEDTCLVAMGGAGADSSNLLDFVQILMHHENQLVVYDLKSHALRSIGLLCPKQKLRTYYFLYSNSLVSWD